MKELNPDNFKKILKDELGKGFEDQARLINSAFQEQKEHFDNQISSLKTDIQSLDKRIAKLEKRMDKLNHSMAALSGKVTNYLQLSDKRYLELKRRDLIIAQWLKQIADKSGVPIDLAELERI